MTWARTLFPASPASGLTLSSGQSSSLASTRQYPALTLRFEFGIKASSSSSYDATNSGIASIAFANASATWAAVILSSYVQSTPSVTNHSLPSKAIGCITACSKSSSSLLSARSFFRSSFNCSVASVSSR